MDEEPRDGFLTRAIPCCALTGRHTARNGTRHLTAASILSDIFGIKQQLGTEQALLSIGSTITELSQNCTASSEYLANFAKRMGGVGKAANMTLPQLIAIGAVLDANGQAAEMSATAVSKLIMDAYKESDKFAKALNLNAEQFKKVMAEDANAGFLMIIERFKEIGNMDALAPVFKDMGENGARASQVMATLANNIDMVKWEQEEAQKAFDKATKVTQMYDIQNNTAQAGIEKARKRVTALAAELGEKLLPVMRHVYTSSSLTLRFLSTTVTFIFGTQEGSAVIDCGHRDLHGGGQSGRHQTEAAQYLGGRYNSYFQGV